jgi:hypothetical protein
MSAIAIDPARLERVQALTLDSGGHNSPDDGMCVMEAVAFVAGEPFSDHPKCACPVIGAFMRAWNDGLPEVERNTLLRPFIPRLVGTRSTKAVEQRRADMALDWGVRVQAPAFLDLSEALSIHASALRALTPLTSEAACTAAMPVLSAAAADASAAWAAARAAAWDAARDAAWDAARAAAWDAAWDAARDAAWDAAWDAARDAAWAAAWAAAWDAARAAIKNMDISGLTRGQASEAARSACVALFAPTRGQRSALELLEAMLAVTPEFLAAADAAESAK